MQLVIFPNLGNTCFLNSILSCLVNQTTFNLSLTDTSSNPILDELTKIFECFKDSGAEINCIRFVPLKLINLIKPRFRRFDQHDAHEFLIYILENINAKYYTGLIKQTVTCNKCKTKSITREEFNTITLNKQYCDPVSQCNPVGQCDPVGQCNPVGPCDPGNKLISLFMDYLKPEELNGYFCEKCNKCCNSVKNLNL